MLRDKTLISHIGLADRDLAVIQSIFRLVARLNKIYEFAGTEKKHSADVLFVNTDDKDAIHEWQAFRQVNQHVMPILVGSGEMGIDGAITLKRPLILKHLIAALESVTSTSVPVIEKPPVVTEALRVLVVDDSFPVRKFMEHKLPELTSEPLDVEFAQTGEEALQKIENAAYDLVFLDVVMPGVDGYKVCKRIKSQQSAYVVMLTSKKSPFDKVRGAMSGCNAYVTKPPEDQRLREVLGTCLETRAAAGNSAPASLGLTTG